MTDAIKLSICIATYNRGDYIVATLNSIAAQMRPDVELVVVDGASTDDTFEHMENFKSRVPGIRYHREAQNSGVDRDFDKAVLYATGEYVWLMTDDDIVIDGAVSRICSALESGHDLVVVNSQVRNPDLSRVLCERLIDVHQDAEYSSADRDRFFVEVAGGLTFIGSVVIRRELWLTRERSLYFGSLFVHVGVIFQSPPIGRILLLWEPVLWIRYGVAMWTPRSFDVWMYKWPELIWSFTLYSESTKAKVTHREPWRRPMKLFQFRSKNGYSVDEYRKRYSHLPGWYRACAFFISVFPFYLANTLSILYVAVRSRRNRIPLYDLVNAQAWAPLRQLSRRLFNL